MLGSVCSRRKSNTIVQGSVMVAHTPSHDLDPEGKAPFVPSPIPTISGHFVALKGEIWDGPSMPVLVVAASVKKASRSVQNK